MVWEENKKNVEEHNADYEQGKSSFCRGLSELTGLTNDEFWEMMTCSSDSVLEDQEIIDTRLLSDIPAFEDVTEDSNVSLERDQMFYEFGLNVDSEHERSKIQADTVLKPLCCTLSGSCNVFFLQPE
ncbi:hypothetical protein U0070_018583 [Myodes glareolus]|uniref:Cathepsin propeptide inhibitor domain-containing protein n=1 Tax=Myodes glareolus TaxID=447135 RepID=A0AAW0ICZ5_MYOGA